jgi:phosphohistidine phosphatase
LKLYLVHHGDAVGPGIDPRRPLSPSGRMAVDRLAAECALKGAKPSVVWHSGKLRAKQTAEAYWRACNALAQFSAARNLQPDDRPQWIADQLLGETRDILIAGHFPHLPRLLALLLKMENGAEFPAHGVVALETSDEGRTWREMWKLKMAEG